jgi:hypothetical protein
MTGLDQESVRNHDAVGGGSGGNVDWPHGYRHKAKRIGDALRGFVEPHLGHLDGLGVFRQDGRDPSRIAWRSASRAMFRTSFAACRGSVADMVPRSASPSGPGVLSVTAMSLP